MKLRCFIAIEIPDEIKKKISVLKKEIHGKCVPDENMHITVKFLGNVEEKYVSALVKKLKTIHFSSFDIVCKGAGAFPKNNHARVLWVGCESPELYALAENIQKLLPPVEKFVGHVTVARMGYQDVTACVDKYKQEIFGKMHCSSFVLKKSMLTPKGSVYSTLETFCAD